MKLINYLFGRGENDDGRPGNSYRIIGGALILVGLALLSPGVMDAVIAFLNSALDLGLSLDAPWWIGLPIIFLGFVLFILGFITDHSGSHKGQFVAIRHQSFQPLAGTLPVKALPSRMRRRRIQPYDCELSSFMTGTTINPKAAVLAQQKLASHIAGVRLSDPDAALGYYGIVHIPFQFLAGCSISTYPEVLLFEHDRSNGNWTELKSGAGQNLTPKVARISDPTDPSAVVIRIEISYPVAPAEVSKIIPTGYREYKLTIANPGIDKITHYGQVEAICVLFRNILDEVHNQLSANLPIHVFYAGPVSLGFSLGRRISRTIHNQVFVYNFTAQTNPGYSWGIDVTRDAPAESMVVTPQVIGL